MYEGNEVCNRERVRRYIKENTNISCENLNLLMNEPKTSEQIERGTTMLSYAYYIGDNLIEEFAGKYSFEYLPEEDDSNR